MCLLLHVLSLHVLAVKCVVIVLFTTSVLLFTTVHAQAQLRHRGHAEWVAAGAGGLAQVLLHLLTAGY
jgi:hypothetical protein